MGGLKVGMHGGRPGNGIGRGAIQRRMQLPEEWVITKSMKMKTKTMGPPRRRLCLILPVAAGLDPSEILLPL